MDRDTSDKIEQLTRELLEAETTRQVELLEAKIKILQSIKE